MSAPAAEIIRPTSREVKHVLRAFEVKAIDKAARTFTGLAAAFSLDQGGDVIMPGAFKRTLADWRRAKSKRIIYLTDSHNYRTIRSVLGKMIEAEETDKGLQTTQEVIEGPDGDEAWRRVEGGFINAMSIGYVPIAVRMPDEEQRQQGIFRLLQEIRLEENALVIFPMNNDARLDAVKALLLEAKSRTLDPDELDELKSVEAQIRALLAAAPPDAEPAPAEPPKGLAPDDPRRIRCAEVLRDLTLRRLGAGL
jgi:Escherichia/Staphylococcus phage prohead protease